MTDYPKPPNKDPFLHNSDTDELRIAAEFLSKWLPFLSRGLCKSCTQTLSQGIRSLHTDENSADYVQSSSNLNHNQENHGNCTAHSVGSTSDSADYSDHVDTHSLGNWKDECEISSEHAVEASTPSETFSSSTRLTSPTLKKSWADMALEDDNAIGLVAEGTPVVVAKPKVELSRNEREQIQFDSVERKKDSICLERVGGEIVNILDGLELHKGVFCALEQKRIVSYVEDLQQMRRDGELKGSDAVAKKELNVLWRRVKTSATLFKYLKSKARIMAVPDLAHTSCGIKQLDGVGFVDKNGVPLSSWSRNVDISFSDSADEEAWTALSSHEGSIDEQDGIYISELLKSVHMVTDVMESLVKRIIMAESDTAIEKEKVTVGQEEIKKKAVQIETMSVKLEEMEQFALGTNSILNEMRQRVEDLVEETSRQRQRATENEQELCRVKQDFETLKSYVTTLLSVRETLLSSEKQFQTIEKHFERLVAKTSQLENEKMQKEAEVQKLMEENVRLSAVLDKKEAQLVAMNEQCKVMALNASNI